MIDTRLRGFFDDYPREITGDDVLVLYRWLSIPRIATLVVSCAAIGAFWLLQSIDFDPRPVLFGLIPAFLIVSYVINRLIRRKFMPLSMLNLQIFADLIAIAFGVLLTGGVRSPFVGLFILVIISASLISVRTLVGVGVLTALLYEAMAIVEHAGLNPIIPGMSRGYQQQDVITIVIFGLIVALIAFQSSYYVSRIREKDEEVLKLKDEFLFRTIHDLRSPSTVIRLVLEKYREVPAIRANAEASQDMEQVRNALGRMSNLIEDLLKLSAGMSPVFVVKAEPVDVPAVIASVVEGLTAVMEKKGARFSQQVPPGLPKARGDAEKLKEAFDNFIENAVKYNRQGGTITVTYRVDGSALVTEIADTGVGISEDSLKKLFSPYFRGDASKEIQGTGLGLYMTRKLLERMGGSVDVRSEQGKGTTFAIRLPIATS